MSLSADASYAPAQNMLACIKGLKGEHAASRELFQKAARQNYSVAQHNIGKNMMQGTLRFEKDEAQALYWYRLDMKMQSRLCPNMRDGFFFLEESTLHSIGDCVFAGCNNYLRISSPGNEYPGIVKVELKQQTELVVRLVLEDA